MIIPALAAAVVLVAVMVAIYRYGDRLIAADAIVPVHAGPGGWDHWRPKKSGLRTWPIGGAGRRREPGRCRVPRPARRELRAASMPGLRLRRSP
jgi:hypothetical protein